MTRAYKKTVAKFRLAAHAGLEINRGRSVEANKRFREQFLTEARSLLHRLNRDRAHNGAPAFTLEELVRKLLEGKLQ